VTRSIYFDHIPKTGGTTFHKILSTWFGEGQVSPSILGRRFSDVMVQYHHLTAISGHIHYGLGDTLSKNRINVTIIRDPVDRALSQYFYRKETRANRTRHDQKMFECSLEDFLSQGDATNLAEYSNVYVRHFAPLCSDYHSNSGALDDRRLLQCARDALSQFDVVGLFTELEDFSAITAISTGISRHVPVPRLNVTQNRPPVDKISRKALVLLRERNEMDIELAAFAVEQFRRIRTRTLIQSVPVSAGGAQNTAEQVNAIKTTDARMDAQDTGSREIEILSIVARGSLSIESNIFTGEELCIAVKLLAHVPADDLTVGIYIRDPSGINIFGTNSRLLGMAFSIATPGQLVIEFQMKCELGLGEYLVGGAVHKGLSHLEKCYHWRSCGTSFKVVGALGSYFEGRTRLYPSVCIMGADRTPASYQTWEDKMSYPRTVMLHSQPLTEFKAGFFVEHFDYQPKPGEIFNMECLLTNHGSQAWPIAGTRPVSVCYHWLNADRVTAIYDGIRTRLTTEISGGQTVRVLAHIQAPDHAGSYTLQITAVQDGVGWFDENGCASMEIPITVSY
jgi:hypothetical protein